MVEMALEGKYPGVQAIEKQVFIIRAIPPEYVRLPRQRNTYTKDIW
jgi:hypothetical protein